MKEKENYQNHPNIKARIFQLGISQERVALAAGYDPTLFSRILNGIRPTPPDFEARVNATLDRLEAAEKAATEARERVLAGEGVEEVAS